MEDSNGGSKASVAATVIDTMNSITDFFSVPDEGTPLRPIVRSCRVAFESTFSDLTKTANTEAKSLAANIQTQALGAQESISKEGLEENKIKKRRRRRRRRRESGEKGTKGTHL